MNRLTNTLPLTGGVVALYHKLIRPRILRRGATTEEVNRVLRGDKIPPPKPFRTTMTTTILYCLIFLGWQKALSQDIYYTRNATLYLNGGLDGIALMLQTNELNVALDYETTNIIIRFPVRSLTTDMDSLQAWISKVSSEVIYEGKLGLDYINTKNHPPMQFTMEGWLNINGVKNMIEGTGELHHIGKSNQIACVLGLKMILDLEALNIRVPVNGLDSKFEVVITQALLQRDKN